MAELVDTTTELLQQLIRNECVNDGTKESGHELRSVDTLQGFLEGEGLDVQRYEPAPGRGSLVARIEGKRPHRAFPLSHGPHRRRPGQRGRLGQ